MLTLSYKTAHLPLFTDFCRFYSNTCLECSLQREGNVEVKKKHVYDGTGEGNNFINFFSQREIARKYCSLCDPRN